MTSIFSIFFIEQTFVERLQHTRHCSNYGLINGGSGGLRVDERGNGRQNENRELRGVLF